MTQARDEQGETTDARPRRGSWKRRGCGCFAFFVGAGAALVAFAPLLFGRLVMQSYLAKVNAEIAGELEIEDVALSWTGTQRLEGFRLRDPEGRTVADFDLEVPSIFQLLSAADSVSEGREGDFGRILGTLELALVTGPDSLSNLERALEGRHSENSSSAQEWQGNDGVVIRTEGSGDEELTISVAENVRFAALELELQVKHFSWADPRFDESGRALGVKDLFARVVLEPGQPGLLTVRGEHLYGEEHAPLSADFEIDMDRIASERPAVEMLSGAARIAGLQVAPFDRFYEADGELLSVIGQELDLDFALERPREDGQRVGLAWVSEQQSMSFGARIEDGVLYVAEDAPAEWTLHLPYALLERELEGQLPGGLTLAEPADGGVELNIAIERCVLPLEGESTWDRLDLVSSATIPTLGIRHLDHGDFELQGLQLTLESDPEGPLFLRFGAREARGGDLSLGFRLPPGWYEQRRLQPDALPSDYRLELKLTDLPVARVAPLLSDPETVHDWLTEPVQLVLRVQPSGGTATHAELEVDSGGNQLRCFATVGEDYIELDPGRSRVTLVASTDDLRKLAGEAWPADLELNSESGRVRAQLHLREARWPLEGGVGSAQLEARISAVQLSNPALREAGQELAIDSLAFSADVDADEPVALLALLDLAGGEATASLRAQSLESLAELDAGAEPTWSAELTSAGLPTQLIDTLAEQDGLLLDVFGPQLELSAEVTDWKAGAAHVRADLHSANAQLAWTGRLADGVLQSTGEAEVLDASVGLTPLFQERIVGNLLPMLVGVEAVEGGSPALLQVRNFSLPLSSADRSALAGAQGDVRLELGKVRCAVVPSLGRMLSSQVHQLRPTQLPTIDLKIRDGFVVADAVPIEIEATSVVFAGRFGLVDRRMDFTCSVPLSGMRGDVGRVLDEARDYLDPELQVPLRVHGDPRRPKVGIDSDFLKQVVRDSSARAAEDALEKGLRKLFEKD